MSLETWPGIFAYLAIFLAAAVEGEVVFVAASVLVGLGKLNPVGVFAAGALGGSAGDQFYFYVCRGRFWHLLDRFPAIAAKGKRVVEKVRRHATSMILASRFLPGLRIAIPAACAYSGVPALQFSLFSLISGMAWAGVILALVAWGGPSIINHLGFDGWWGPIVPACMIIVFFYWIGKTSKRK